MTVDTWDLPVNPLKQSQFEMILDNSDDEDFMKARESRMRRSSAGQPQAKKVMKPLVIKQPAKHIHRSSLGDKVSRYRRGHLAHLDAVHQQRASLLPELLRTRGSSGFYNAYQESQPSGTTYDFREGTHDARGSYDIETIE